MAYLKVCQYNPKKSAFFFINFTGISVSCEALWELSFLISLNKSMISTAEKQKYIFKTFVAFIFYICFQSESR